MSIADSNVDLNFATPAFPVRRFSVDEYHRMIEAELLMDDDRVELLEGWIVPKMVRRPRHDAVIELVESALRQLIPPGYRLRTQSAITTSDSEPEPDLAIVKGDARDHVDRHPHPSEVQLVIEVADTSVQRDREKRRLYARAGIPQYWIVNLDDAQIEVYSAPNVEAGDATYSEEMVVGQSDRLAVTIFEGLTVDIDCSQILP